MHNESGSETSDHHKLAPPDANAGPSASPSPRPRRTRLTARQQQRLTDALDALFLELERGFKMRTTPTSPLRTLRAYLAAATRIPPLILLTPPAHTGLRTPFLLRYTSELLGALPGYAPDGEDLPMLLDTLEGLDSGWCAVLRGEAWDATRGLGVPAEGEVEGGVSAGGGVTITERIRLRSALVSGTTRMEEWLERLPPPEDGLDVRAKLGRIGPGVRARFEALFVRTLDELGYGAEDGEEEGVRMTELVDPGALRRFGDGEGAGLGVEEDGWIMEVDDLGDSDGDEGEFMEV